MTTLFQTYNLKYPNKAILVPNLTFLFLFFLFFFFLLNFLHFDKFQGADSKYHDRFVPIFSLKIPKSTFFVSNLRIFIFARNFFKLTTQNYTNKAFFVSKLKLFMLHELPFHKFEGTNSKYKIKYTSKNIEKRGFFLSQI